MTSPINNKSTFKSPFLNRQHDLQSKRPPTLYEVSRTNQIAQKLNEYAGYSQTTKRSLEDRVTIEPVSKIVLYEGMEKILFSSDMPHEAITSVTDPRFGPADETDLGDILAESLSIITNKVL